MRLRSLWVSLPLVGLLVIGGCQDDKHDSRSGTSPTDTAQAFHTGTKPVAAQVPQSEPTYQRHPGELLAHVLPQRPPQEMTLVSIPVATAPIIDGHADEPFWATAPAIITLDFSSQQPITLKSVYTTDEVFFLVSFPDQDASEVHKVWRWDAKEEVYREGPEREDVFVFKWSLSGNNVNLALREAEPHHADIWFWKACRTNPAGYADDKWQSVLSEARKDTRLIPSPQHGTLYFLRQGDVGDAPWEEKFFFEYQGDRLTKYYPRQPTGSRGDIRAKGVWSNGQWTIEFARKFDTGHDDDVVLTPGGVHLFGVSRYAIAFDTPHVTWSQPLYRTGDTFDRLFFTMAPRDGK